MLTPEVVHYGRAAEALATRQRRLDDHYAKHPERYVNGPPQVPSLPKAVWINPPEDRSRAEMAISGSSSQPGHHRSSTANGAEPEWSTQ